MRRTSRYFAILAGVVVTFGFVNAAARAQVLADRVPEDCMVYLGWRGTDSMPPGYEKSHLRALLAASNIPAVFNDLLPRALARIAREDRDAAQAIDAISTLGAPLWKYPTAIYFGMNTEGAEPLPRAAILCKAGKDSANVQQKLDSLLAEAGQGPVPVKTFMADDIVGLSIGYEDANMALSGGAGANRANPLSANTAFVNALGKAGGPGAGAATDPAADAMAVVYIDGENVLAFIDAMVEKSNEKELTDRWPKIREASGLTGFKRIVITAGFDGPDWATKAFMEAPVPRKGLLTVFDVNPVSDDLLKLAPVTSTSVMGFTFDAAKFVTDIRTAVGEVDPNAQQMMDQGLGAVKMYVFGKDLVNDILGPLGPQWLIYSDPTTGGSGFTSFVIVNKLDDAAKAQAGISALVTSINNSVAGLLRDKGMEIQIRSTQVGDVKVSYVAVPFISPAWAIKDGNLYFALYPQIVATAAKRGAPQQSVLDNPAYVAVRKRLGVERPTAITFVDLPKTTPQQYGTMLVLTRTAMGFADLFGVRSPELVLPPLEELMKHVSPAGGADWVDETGVYSKHISPFPGALLAGGSMGPEAVIGLGAMQMGILLPSLNRARETANRVKCASNMRQIGQGILLYSNDNRGQYPPDLGTLLSTVDISPEVFLCPSAGGHLPPGFNQMTPEQKAAWVNENAAYTYVGAGMNNSVNAETIVLYEHDHNHDRDGMNMLFGDGHVEFNLMRQARQMLQQQGR
jgi:prepilin-type processing-associated H-X9-DG protein